jgi:hypothetical protein
MDVMGLFGHHEQVPLGHFGATGLTQQLHFQHPFALLLTKPYA